MRPKNAVVPEEMNVQIITRPVGRSPGWRPFPYDPRFEPNWWDQRMMFPEDGLWMSGTVDQAELVRAELDVALHPQEYLDVRNLRGRLLEIQFIEVAEDSRRHGFATAMVTAIADRFPGHVLAAFSEDADDFWESLGWTKFDHPEGWPWYRPLFLQLAQEAP